MKHFARHILFVFVSFCFVFFLFAIGDFCLLIARSSSKLYAMRRVLHSLDAAALLESQGGLQAPPFFTSRITRYPAPLPRTPSGPCKWSKARMSIFEKSGGAGSTERKHERFCKVHLYNLTSIIMDKVRRFMNFAMVEVVNYAAAI